MNKVLEKVKLVWTKTNRWHRGLLLLFIIEWRVLPSRQLGFTCNDPALSHPFTGDTISWKLLLSTTILLPLPIMLIVERIYRTDKLVKPKEQALRWYKEYLYGLLINILVVELLKSIVGSPRPHFFDSCEPKEANTCQGSEYVSSYTCSKGHWVSSSNRSFPSGHTSLAIHTGIFLAYYLYRRTTSPTSKRILSVQIVCVATAVLCSLSRLTDRRHHWWDVLAGAALAAPILRYTTHSLCGNFECSHEQNTCKRKTEESTECNQSVDQAS